METRTNITLIDANRNNSVREAGDSVNQDNSRWVNEISSGLRLNVGDKVSVHSSFISEVGCGDQALETSGKLLKNQCLYMNTLTSSSNNPKSITEQYRIEYGPYGAKRVDSTQGLVEIQPKDNEFHVVISYYKNSNGENYIHLPRRFDTQIDPLSTTIPFDALGTTKVPPVGWKKRDDERAKVWWQCDNKNNGQSLFLPTYRCLADWHWYMGLNTVTPYSEVRNLGIAANKPYPFEEGEEYYDENMWKKKNDNSRYTMYRANTTFYRHDAEGIEDVDVGFDAMFDGMRSRDGSLAWQRYSKYKEHKAYSITDGFNDPHNVAYQLTSQFSDPNEGPLSIKTNQIDYVAPTVGGGGVDLTTKIPNFPAPVTMTSKGETYKPFAASNYKTWDKANAFTTWENATAFNDQAGTPAEIIAKKQYLCDYLSNSNMIGVKRPEIWDAGRYLYDTMNLDNWDADEANSIVDATETTLPVQNSYPGGEETVPQTNESIGGDYPVNAGCRIYTTNSITKTSTQIDTNIPWNERNVRSWSAFFQSQALYPEVLDFPKRDTSNNNAGTEPSPMVMDTPPLPPNLETNLDGATTGLDDPLDKRYFHMNSIFQNEFIYTKYGNNTKGHRLGADFIRSTDIQAYESFPVFFKYDQATEDIYRDDARLIQNDPPSMGWAYKTYKDATADIKAGYYITFKATVPQEVIGDATWGLNWAMGYDWHFNAYGTDCISLYSGWMPQSYDQTSICGMRYQGLETAGNPRTGVGGPTGAGGVGTRVGVDVPNDGYTVSGLAREVYLGAIDPIIQFSDANSRFQIGGLHTPEWIQNPADAGKPLSTPINGLGNIASLPDAGDEVYKINKKLSLFNNFCPDMVPYRLPTSYTNPVYASDSSEIKRITPAEGGIPGETFHALTVGSISGGSISNAGGPAKNGYILEGTSDVGNNSIDPAVSEVNNKTPTAIFHTKCPTTQYGGSLNTGEGARPVTAQHQYDETNPNLSKFIIYDSNCGIFLEDFGISDEDDWNASLFGIMGFSYSQFRGKKQSRQTKLTRINYNQVTTLTTNANVPQKDLPTAIKNIWQKTIYTCQIPMPQLTNLSMGFVQDLWWQSAEIGAQSDWNSTAAPPDKGLGRKYLYIGDVNQSQVYPSIVNPQTSALITAEGLPVKMKSPYYLIKSDIIADSFYIRDKTPLPIVSVANKENGFGDFYFQGPSQIEFIITDPVTITSVTTEIMDSDMTPARVDRNSGVIYKVEKNITVNPDLVGSILKNNMTNRKGTIDLNTTNLL